MDPNANNPQYPPAAPSVPNATPPLGVGYPAMPAQAPAYQQPQYAQPQPAYPQQQYPGQPVYGAMPPQATVQPAATSPAPKPVKPKGNPNSTQNALQIAEIRDGIVIMNDGSFRSVLMLKSINFDLMSPQEREAVEYSYQGFLNSLYFDVQIFIRSQKVDIGPYIDRLDKIRSEHDNMLLALLMEDYIGYMTNIAQQTNIMDKKFYVVIPFSATPNVQQAITQSKNFFTGLMGLFSSTETKVVINEADLNKAKDELRNRIQSVLSGLQQCGVQGLPLDTQELIELYYDTYNPDTATRQQLKNFDDLTAPVITKGQGVAHQPNLDRELL
jgi:hypothetical protein